jgi:hypothetical protein
MVWAGLEPDPVVGFLAFIILFFPLRRPCASSYPLLPPDTSESVSVRNPFHHPWRPCCAPTPCPPAPPGPRSSAPTPTPPRSGSPLLSSPASASASPPPPPLPPSPSQPSTPSSPVRPSLPLFLCFVYLLHLLLDCIALRCHIASLSLVLCVHCKSVT